VASTARSRRRVTAIAVPSAMAAIMAGAFAAAPAIAATSSTTPALPFPTVCTSGQPAPGATSASPSASPSGSTSSTASPSASPTGTVAKANNIQKSAGAGSAPSVPPPATSAGGTTKATPTSGAPASTSSSPPRASTPASASASPSPSASATSTDGGGFWGWLNGIWTWIFGDDTTSSSQGGAISASETLGSTPDVSSSPSASAHTSSPSVAKSSSGTGSGSGGPVAGAASNPATTAAASPSASASSSATAASTPSSTASPDCISSASAAALAAKAAADGTSEGVSAGTTPWVLKTPSLLLYDLTYNGVKTVQVWNSSTSSYESEQVLDFTASKLTIDSMVTYSIQDGQTVYNNAGSGTTTTLTDPHLMVVKMTAQLLGLIPQTYTPSNQPPLPVGLTIPLIPILFTNVTTQLAFLNTGTISVPGFNGFAQTGIADPQ
jgi:hypothetical protein